MTDLDALAAAIDAQDEAKYIAAHPECQAPADLAEELAAWEAEQAKAAACARRREANVEAVRRGRGHRNTGAQSDWEGWVY